MHRRRFLISSAAAATTGLATWTASAQGTFPARPVTLICPWPAGGPTDIVMRSMAEAASKHLGQPVVVDNKAGASGTLGAATMAASAKPDGYTIAQMPIPMVRLPMMQKTSWNVLSDFTWVIHMTGYIFGVTSRGDGPFKSWDDVIAYAKANPGKLNYGTPGTGTTLHIAMEQMAIQSGVKFNQVPFKGEAEALAALLGGHVDLMASGTSRTELAAAGQLRILNIWAEKRSKRIPDVPTLRELGYPFVFDSPWGFAGPKGMDPNTVQILHDAFKKALDDPHVLAVMEKHEMVPRYMSSADYAAFMPKLAAQERSYLDRIGLLKKE